MQHKNRGFVLIAAIILIVVAAAMAAALATLVSDSTRSGALHIGSGQSLYAAEAGVERGIYERNRSSWNCITPATQTGTVGSGGASTGYSVSCVTYLVTTTLTSAISNSSTVIPVASLVGIAPYGRVKIGTEYIDYPATSTTACGAFATPCLVNARRGVENSTAAAHSSAASVNQDQAILTSVGSGGFDGTTRTLSRVMAAAATILPPSANANFNAQAGVCNPASCSPTGWLLSASGDSSGQRWDDTGGPDGSRSAVVVKPSNGPTAGTTAGQFTFSPSITITGPTTLTFTFDYKHEFGEPASGTMSLTFVIREEAPGTNSWTSAVFEAGRSPGYRSGSVTMSIPQTGTFSINKMEFSLVAKAGQAKTIYLDNIALTGAGASGNKVVRLWRESFP